VLYAIIDEINFTIYFYKFYALYGFATSSLLMVEILRLKVKKSENFCMEMIGITPKSQSRDLNHLNNS
jgi:hypothetical protein